MVAIFAVRVRQGTLDMAARGSGLTARRRGRKKEEEGASPDGWGKIVFAVFRNCSPVQAFNQYVQILYGDKTKTLGA